MLDREKIKAGLISCTSVEQENACPVCPYKPLGNLCNMALMRDALAIIREQDPRVMTFEEDLEGGAMG